MLAGLDGDGAVAAGGADEFPDAPAGGGLDSVADRQFEHHWQVTYCFQYDGYLMPVRECLRRLNRSVDNLNNLYVRYALRVTCISVERDDLGAKIPPEAWHALLVNGSPRHYRVGEVLVRQGEPGRYVLALTSGLVKVTKVEPDGHEQVLAVRGRGEIIGVITYLDSQQRSATVTAISACLAYMVSEVRFRRIVSEFNIGDAILRHVASRLRESEDIRSELASLAPRRRIARMLLRFSVGEYCVLSQWDIAKAVGLSRSAVAGELAWLREHGLVSTGRGRVTITDLAKLNDLADGRADQ